MSQQVTSRVEIESFRGESFIRIDWPDDDSGLYTVREAFNLVRYLDLADSLATDIQDAARRLQSR